LRRHPGTRRVLWVGLVLGLAVLVNQESAIMATILALLALISWLAARPWLDRLRDRADGVSVPAGPLAARHAVVAPAQARYVNDWFRTCYAG
jgi:drug/metabolite transporter (DMT)-like permease